MKFAFLPLHIPNNYRLNSAEVELAKLSFERLDALAISGLGFYHSLFNFEPRPRLKSLCLDCTSLINTLGSLDFLFQL